MSENMTKYPSMMQTYHQKEIATWLSHWPDLAVETFVVSEKIHGANAQLSFRRDTPIRYFSRECEILPGHDMYGKLMNALDEPVVVDAIGELQAAADLMDLEINLFGELFGKGIQKGVNYGLPDGQKVFRAFDIMIGGSWLSQKDFSYYPPIKNIRVPNLGLFNSLEDALDYDVDKTTTFNSDLEGNIWEGVVIKPYNKVYVTPQGSMFHIKKKHPKFEEKKNEKLPREIDPEVDSINTLFLGYFNDNRVQSYFSKHGEIQEKTQIGTYVKGIVEDGKADFLKDHSDLLAQLDPSKHKAALNIGGTIANLLKPYL